MTGRSTSEVAILRAVARRINAIDPVDLLESDRELLARAQSLYDGMRDSIVPPPPRSQVLEALAQ